MGLSERADVGEERSGGEEEGEGQSCALTLNRRDSLRRVSCLVSSASSSAQRANRIALSSLRAIAPCALASPRADVASARLQSSRHSARALRSHPLRAIVPPYRHAAPILRRFAAC